MLIARLPAKNNGTRMMKLWDGYPMRRTVTCYLSNVPTH
jgi:hypothetical protein